MVPVEKVKASGREMTMYKPSKKISAFHVAGVQHYDGALALGKLKPGKTLKMVPESDNPYDPCAIELRFKKAKLGYAPRDENDPLALMAFYGHKGVFEARVLQVDPELAGRLVDGTLFEFTCSQLTAA